MYQLLPTDKLTGLPASFILRIADNAFIPFDEGNTDYVAYLAWIAEGNEPLPASA